MVRHRVPGGCLAPRRQASPERVKYIVRPALKVHGSLRATAPESGEQGLEFSVEEPQWFVRERQELGLKPRGEGRLCRGGGSKRPDRAECRGVALSV